MQKSKVFTGGSFDLFHYGHVNFLRQCSKLGEVIVGLNTDRFILEHKKHQPILFFSERKRVLEGCKYVSKVIKMPDSDKEALLKIKPNYWIIGSDWKGRYLQQTDCDKKWLKEHNIKFRYLPYTKGISSTEITRRLYDKTN
jgi:glycerol-3-phosphate cytidylyltransferase